MRLHLGRLFISILFGHFHVFSGFGDYGFLCQPLGRVQGVNINGGFQSVILFLRNVSRPTERPPRAHHQEQSVEEYVAQFMEIKMRIKGITSDEALDRFKRGLKPQICLDVKRASAGDLYDAMLHALRADDILHQTMTSMRQPAYNRGNGSPRNRVQYESHMAPRNDHMRSSYMVWCACTGRTQS